MKPHVCCSFIPFKAWKLYMIAGFLDFVHHVIFKTIRFRNHIYFCPVGKCWWRLWVQFFFFFVKVNSAGKILQYPTIHADFAVLLLKEVVWYSEYRDSWFTNYLVKVKEITDELTLNQNSKQLVEIKTDNYSRLNEPKRKRIASKNSWYHNNIFQVNVCSVWDIQWNILFLYNMDK